MSTPNSRKRVTVIASIEGIEKAERALIRLGFESKSNFAKAQLISRSAITKFFNREPIQLDTFKRICDGLDLKWREILDQNSTLSSFKQNRSEFTELAENGVTIMPQQESIQALTRQVTVVNKENKVEAVIKLKGDIDSIDSNFKATLEVLLRSHTGCEIEVNDIQEGCIKITIEGNQQGIKKLIEQFASGELTNIEGFPIETIYPLIEELLEGNENSNYVKSKWEVVQEILVQPRVNRNLQDTDLSDVNLSGAILIDADLIDADLRKADLSRAKLSGAYLNGAKLSGADLSRADLKEAYLNGADLSGAILAGANLSGATLSGVDLSEAYLSKAYLSRATLIKANLIDADLSGATLSGVDLSRANLSGATLSRAYLSRATLNRADLNGSVLNETVLNGAYLIGADLNQADLIYADLREADLSGAYLNRADLSGAICNRAKLSGAYLVRAKLKKADLSGADLSGADLSGADLSEAIVENTLFGRGSGLSDNEKQALARRGAIFDDTSGDRGATFLPTHR